MTSPPQAYSAGFFVSILLILLTGLFWIYNGLKRRKLNRLRREFFETNGGISLVHRLRSTYNGSSDQTTSTMIFTEAELKKATKNYHGTRILIKRGDFGTVYEGILPDKKSVVIKKSTVTNAPIYTDMSQLVNAAIVLSQAKHPNVVRILGCCLETQLPIMVYEYYPRDPTLYEKLRQLPWKIRIKIASAIAAALVYLHSEVFDEISQYVNVKATNILIDENNEAKISDLGYSGAVPTDLLPSFVEETLGYLDPEYLRLKTLSEKSDVYSFGVVLVVLLTSKEAFSFDRPEAERNLAHFFVCSMEKGCLNQILDSKLILDDGDFGTVGKVADIAQRCLKLKGEERPTLKDVAMELEGLMPGNVPEHSGEGNTTNVPPSPKETNQDVLESTTASYAYIVDVKGDESESDEGDDDIKPSTS